MSEEIQNRSADASATKKVFFRKRKGCPLSVQGAPEITYKNPNMLSKLISDGGRILPSRITNVSASNQRILKREIKIARVLALLPFVSNNVK
ncbi:MAG: ribosomal protein [Pseudomonadota bacterium]|jgi:small subunit ribosomal protein S18